MEKNPWSEHAFKSPKMNFKVNLFFHLYETHFTPLGIPDPDSPEGKWWGGLGEVIKEKRVIEDPPSQLNRKLHHDYYFFY